MSNNSSAYATVCAVFDFSEPERLDIRPKPWVDPYDTNYGLTSENCKIYNKDIQLDFKKGEGQGGVVIYKTTVPYFETKSWQLIIHPGAHIIVNALNGCTLESVDFCKTGGSLTKGTHGSYDYHTGIWTAEETTNTTDFDNGFNDSYFSKIKVYYRKNSSQTDYIPSKQISGQELEYFNSTDDVKFNLKINDNYNENGVTLNKSNKMTPTVKGSTVNLKNSLTHTNYGDYNININKGTFMNSNGDVYDAIEIPFKVNPKRDIIDYANVSPEQLTFNKLPKQITLTYGDTVNVIDGSIGYVYKNGVRQFPLEIKAIDKKVVMISHTNDINQEGTYTFEIPAKVIYNNKVGNISDERWNPELSFRYIISENGDDIPINTKTAYITFSNNSETLAFNKGTVQSIKIKVNNVSNIKIKNNSLPYFKKQGSTSTVIARLNKVSDTEFSISVQNLPVGVYKLYIPAETFDYLDKDVVGVSAELSLTIKDGERANIKYDYPGAIETRDNFPPNPYRNVYAVEWLNNLVYFVMCDSLIFNPDARVELVNINGAHIRSGHFEEYPNYKQENNCEWCGELGLKIVFDPPLDEGDCKLLSGGTYFLEVPKGAVGDSNYGKWLKDHSFTGECHTNNKFYVSYFLNNKILEM